MNEKIPLLIDFDGVLKTYGAPAPYLANFFDYINKNEIPHCILSNSTLKSSDSILEFLKENKIEHRTNALTAIDSAAIYSHKNYKKVFPVCKSELIYLFDELIDENNPDAVVIGDIGSEWNYDIITKIFNFVFNGSDLVAIHKNKFWSPDGIHDIPDAGLFISGLEYVTGKKAKLIGKPAKEYFYSALDKIGFSKTDFLMLGDDLETDIAGAKKIGGETILILTGKTKLPLPENLDCKPNFVAKDLKEVVQILEKIYD